MNKILLSMAAVSALAIGAPAMAQQGGYDVRGDTRIDLRIGELQSRLQAGIQSGSITRQEAQPLRMQLRDLTRLERQFARDGLNRAERQELQGRVQQLRQQIRTAEMSGGGRWQDRDGRDGQGWNRDCPPGLEKRNNGCIPPGQEGRDGRWEERRGDRDDRWEDRRGDDRRYDSPYDRNRDGYDDRDTNRDSRDGDYRDGDCRDGDYRDGERRRGGIVGQVIDRVTGGGGLRVGQRVSGNLGALPYEYRNQYRDGNGAYYRTDGRNIYRIDARTDVVLQVHSMNR
ncbi:MAG TPA: hypothetical protein VEZ20_11525 [Allosphingosinicella sp.]|jgi:hypothetical protein|nr:hypothetical protein [Allosphingosinicella sp.]